MVTNLNDWMKWEKIEYLQGFAKLYRQNKKCIFVTKFV